MGERKVLNKYYPGDFDPLKLYRRRKKPNRQINVRMMLPMSMRCHSCGLYMYKGTKFNSRKEDAVGERYLGIQILRFYFKCSRCAAEVIMKTDPRNSDYMIEDGASAWAEPYEEETKQEAEDSCLEKRSLDSKREIDITAGLEEMTSMKRRRETISLDAMLAALKEKKAAVRQKLEEEDEALIKSLFFNKSKDYVKRIRDHEDVQTDDDGHSLTHKVKRQKGRGGKLAVTISIKKSVTNTRMGLQSLCYYDSEDDE